ncbi:hypothetical protein IWQ60_005794 [Tieghemiomyces parasiticus]|uniref:type I protein arginine methyltransferase n=1 Tax=Tieghemiomyces parasiticus TaxID=78921 RepID=A0A9W8DY61_9FUNG|nr:hypothetical protein IWQ60_005794 [Tieghemiomyces parasiticus]
MSMVSYSESGFDPQENTWDDWENEEEQRLKCLFCDTIFTDPRTLFTHARDEHGFDFIRLKIDEDLDFYQCVRLINYLREQVQADPAGFNPQSFHVTRASPFLDDDKYLRPVLENDDLLMCFDDVELDALETGRSAALAGYPAPTTELETELMRKVAELQHHLDQAQNATAFISSQFEQYREMVKTHFYEVMDDEARSMISQVMSLSLSRREAPRSAAPPPKVVTVHKDPSNYYFNSYASNGIHETMLKDTVRTEGYRDFVYDNKDLFRDKVVLDIGCGTGILSMFAARAGAKRVIAVDNSDIIDKTYQTVLENKLDGVITLVKGKIEEVTLPVDQVDIIISEWMGYFLLFEAMLDSVLVARDRWLAPDGLLCPSYTRILLSGFQDDDLLTDTLHFWQNVYGFRMSAMTEGFYVDPLVEVIPVEAVNTTVQALKDIDIAEIEVPALDFTTPINLRVTKAGKLHGFMGYFDTYFARRADVLPDQDPEDLFDAYQKAAEEANRRKLAGEPIGGPKPPNPNKPLGHGDRQLHRFTTGPHGQPGHWKQTLFVLKEPLQVEVGDVVVGQFICRKNAENPRDLDIDIEYQLINSQDSASRAAAAVRKQRFYLR